MAYSNCWTQIGLALRKPGSGSTWEILVGKVLSQISLCRLNKLSRDNTFRFFGIVHLIYKNPFKCLLHRLIRDDTLCTCITPCFLRRRLLCVHQRTISHSKPQLIKAEYNWIQLNTIADSRVNIHIFFRKYAHLNNLHTDKFNYVQLCTGVQVIWITINWI